MKKSAIIVIAAIAVLGIGGVLLVTNNKKVDPVPSNHDMGNTSVNSNSNSNEKVVANQVTIKDFAFGPKNMTVKKGTKITWTNQDAAHHDVTPDKDSPDFVASKLLAKGESYSYTFEKAGTYAYHCSPHPYMKAVIEVTE